MQKLASLTIHACTFFMELGTKLSHEIAWEMCFLLKLMNAMSIWASITKFALAIHFKISAQFCLFLAFILLLKLEALFSILESLSFSSSSCFTVFLFHLVHEDEVNIVCYINWSSACFYLILFKFAIWRCSWWFGDSIRLVFHIPIRFLIFNTIIKTISWINGVVGTEALIVEIGLTWTFWISSTAESSLVEGELLWLSQCTT